MELRDLKPSWLDLPFERKLEIVKEIRMSRATPKKPHNKAAAGRREKKSKTLRLIESLTPEELDILEQMLRRKLE